MNRVPLTSSALRSAGYDPATHTLELEFTSGRIYRYQGVPQGTYDWLLRTPSKGSYVARMINDRYPYRDITAGTSSEPQDLAQALRASLDAIGTRKKP
jgi:hypothetical protein